jgi:hypothetical protein
VRKPLFSMALVLAAAYLSLTIAPMVCPIELSDRHAGGHHHGGSLSHSNFCAWACHANSAVGWVSAVFSSESLFAIGALQVKQAIAMPSRSNWFSVSRGPPPSVSLR